MRIELYKRQIAHPDLDQHLFSVGVDADPGVVKSVNDLFTQAVARTSLATGRPVLDARNLRPGRFNCDLFGRRVSAAIGYASVGG